MKKRPFETPVAGSSGWTGVKNPLTLPSPSRGEG
jgi:hypothetical protein